MFDVLSRDADAFIKNDARLQNTSSFVRWPKLLLVTPGFQFVVLLRLQNSVARIPLFGPVLRRLVWFISACLFRSDIDPAAEIGPGFYCPHPFGIIIGGSAVIGSDVQIREGTTLGRPTKANPRDPVIHDRVVIGPRCVLLGGITIGADAVIEGGAIVLRDVPENTTFPDYWGGAFAEA